MNGLFQWVGGKKRVVPQLLELVPKSYEAYHEPFAGSAALFFALDMTDKRVFLNDVNSVVCNTYSTIRDRHVHVKRSLSQLQRLYDAAEDKKSFYNDIRARFNLEKRSWGTPVTTVSKFVFLNRAGYGSLYRENKAGDYNVTFGPQHEDPNVQFYRPTLIDGTHAYLVRNDVTVSNADFEETLLCNAKRGDFVFMDPPYWPTKTQGFTAYHSSRFTVADQDRVFRVFQKLTHRGCKVLLTNSDVEEIRKMYRMYTQIPVHTVRPLHKVQTRATASRELAIMNYAPESCMSQDRPRARAAAAPCSPARPKK